MTQRVAPDRRTSWAARAFTGTLTTLLVALQLGGVAHFLLVQHETCPEHGELVHGRHNHQLGPSASPSSTSGVRESAASPGESEHSHCLVSLHQRTRALSAPVQEILHLVMGEVQPALRALEAPPPSVPVLSVAPKGSPPVC